MNLHPAAIPAGLPPLPSLPGPLLPGVQASDAFAQVLRASAQAPVQRSREADNANPQPAASAARKTVEGRSDRCDERRAADAASDAHEATDETRVGDDDAESGHDSNDDAAHDGHGGARDLSLMLAMLDIGPRADASAMPTAPAASRAVATVAADDPAAPASVSTTASADSARAGMAPDAAPVAGVADAVPDMPVAAHPSAQTPHTPDAAHGMTALPVMPDAASGAAITRWDPAATTPSSSTTPMQGQRPLPTSTQAVTSQPMASSTTASIADASRAVIAASASQTLGQGASDAERNASVQGTGTPGAAGSAATGGVFGSLLSPLPTDALAGPGGPVGPLGPSGAGHLAAANTQAASNGQARDATAALALADAALLDNLQRIGLPSQHRGHLRLQDEQWRTLDIEVRLRGDEAQVAFATDTGAARDLLHRSAAQLREAMAQSGLTLTEVSVGAGTQQGATSDGSRGQPGGGDAGARQGAAANGSMVSPARDAAGAREGANGDAHGGTNDSANRAAGSRAARRGPGALDLFA